MKRIALITTLSLIMCLSMSFPASAAYTIVDDKGFISKMNTIKNQAKTSLPSGYDYVLFCTTVNGKYSTSSTASIYAYFSNTPVLTVGSKYYVGTINTVGTVSLMSNRFNAITAISLIASNGGVEIKYTLDGVGTVYSGGVYSVFVNQSNLSISGYNTDRTLVAGHDWFINFVPTVDPSALQALITQAKAKQNTGYTQASWNALQAQITAAESVLANASKTQAQVDSSKNALQAALNGLVLLPDISALQSLLSQAKAQYNAGYTQSSWNALQAQITAAENLLATTGYTQLQIDSAKNALQAALNGLMLLPDTPDLAALLVEADAIEDVGYTAATWTHFSNSKISSHALLLSKDYTQSQLDYSYNELQSAMFGLTLIPPPEPPDPPKPEPAPLGYDLSTGDISGYLNIVPSIFYNYVLSAKDIVFLIFGIVLSIILIPRVLSVIIPTLRR